MRTRSLPLLVVLAAAIAADVPAFAQQEAPAQTAPEKKAPAGLPKGGKLIPKLEIEGIPLSEVLNYLRDADPDFQAVVSGPGAEGGGPIIQELRLKNVSAASVVQLLGATYPQIRVNALEGDESVIWTIRVDHPEMPVGEGGGFHDGALPDPAMMGMPGGPAPAAQPVTTVHRLREIIDDLARDSAGAPEDRKKAREAVLSLVQATIETQGGGKTPATIKLHEATETLVFKGTSLQASFVEQALGSLRPVPGDPALQNESRRELRALAAEVKELKKRLNEIQAAPLPPVEPNKPKQ